MSIVARSETEIPSSQTLANLSVISEAVTVPVLRPLITYDKEEIITLARRIGTFDAHPGDLACRAVPSMPSTAAVLDSVKKCEERMDIGEISRGTLSAVRFVTALNGEFVNEK